MAFLYIILAFILMFIAVGLIKQRSELAVKQRLLSQNKQQIEDLNKQLDHLSDTLNSVDSIIHKTSDVSSKLLSYQKIKQ